MLAHMRKNHQNSTKIQSPLGSFPSANSATVLQFDDDDEATQGNSDGAVNSPKVVTSGTYMCAVCEIHFPRKEEVTMHMEEAHVTSSQDLQDDNASEEAARDSLDEEDEIMEEWKSIFDQINEVYDTDDKKDEAEAMKEKLQRIINVVQKKAAIIKDMRIKTKQLEEEVVDLEATASNCHECTLKDEVVNNKEALIVKKEAVISKKEKETKDMKKTMENQRKIVQSIKLNYEKSIEENNELKTKVNEQEDIIKHLEEQCGIDTEDEVQEVEVTESRNSMSNNSSGHLCVTCDQTFASNNGLEKHIEDKHTELWCDHCGDMFSNKYKLNNHMKGCAELGMEAVECNKCKKRLVKWGSKRHIFQAPKKLLSCNICERVFITNDQVKKHVVNEHKSKQDKTKIVCRHYRNGNCHKGSRCEYSHVGFVKNISKLEQNSSSTQKVSTCRHGDTCSWLARGVCAFYHRGVGVQKPKHNGLPQTQQVTHQPRPRTQQAPESENSDEQKCPRGPNCIHLSRGSCTYGGVFYHVQQKQQSSSGEDSRLCWDDENCKRQVCKFKHLSLQDFPNLPEPTRPQARGILNQRR